MKKWQSVLRLAELILLLVVILRQLFLRQFDAELTTIAIFLDVLLELWFLALACAGQISSLEPFWIPKRIGVGISVNPKNPLGFWLTVIGVGVMIIIMVILLVLAFI